MIGVQVQNRNFSALGTESIVPVTKSGSAGIFLLEERNWDRWRLEFGGRIEGATQDPQNNVNPSRTFGLFSGSVGSLWKFTDGYGLGLTGTRGQRAPTTEELYMLGAHRGTATYQTGSNDLSKETSSNIDLALRKTTGAVQWKVNGFNNQFNNYIFAHSADTDANGVADRSDSDGTLDDDGEFLIQNFSQAGARFYGVEAETVFKLKPETLDLRLFTDYVRGKLDSGGNIPRATPPRFGLELNHRAGPWTANLSATRVMQQTRTAELETATPGYTLMNIDMSYRIIKTKTNGIRVFLQGKNLLNEEMRLHNSFLKDYAPLPGRALVAGFRGEF